MGIEGIEKLKPGEDPPKKCGKKKVSGWGATLNCLFEAGHEGPHSWVVTG